MTELINNAGFQTFSVDMLRTPEGVNVLNTILRQLAQQIPSDSEAVRIYQGYGSPESNVTAGIGSIYMRIDGSSGTSAYIKESGTGNTGWTAVSSGSGSGDFSSNTSTSVDSEIVLFSGTGGKTGKRATGTGVVIITSGVLSTKTNPSGAFVGDTDTQTLTNKRITQRVGVAADATSITPDIDSYDIITQANTQAAGTLTINAPTGTPTSGQWVILRIKCTNAQTYSWNAAYRASSDLALPTSTTGSSKTDYLGFRYNSADSKYDYIAKTFGF